MSASKIKQQRHQSEGLTEKERRQAADAHKEKVRTTVYIVIGVIAAILAAALLIWNSGFFQSRAAAVTVGDQTFTVSDLSYYYYSAVNSAASNAKTYAQYGLDSGYDPDVAPKDQMYDDNTTYADYFRQTAVTNLQQVVLLSTEAEKAGYTLSSDGQASIDDALSQIDQYSGSYGYSRTAYLRLLYGPYMTESVFIKQLTMSTLASEYQKHYTDSLTYTDDQLESYYKDNAAALDTYDYRYCFISGTPETATDADGNQVTPTDEETAAAMNAAKSKADEMIKRYQAGEDFNKLAAQYVAADSAESYSDPEYNHVTDKLGSELSSYAYGTWLMDASRKTGDITAVESSGSGYYVVTLLSRARLDDSYQSVDVRHILVLAETDKAEDSTEDVLPTKEQLAAAYTKAQDLLAQWKAGDATSDSFAQLANLNSDDSGSNTNGGLYTNVERGTMITSFNDWIFAPGRKVGDTGIVVNTDGKTDDVRGYHVMYLQALGEVRWKYQAKTALASADFSTWLEKTKDSYTPVTNEKNMSLLG